MIEEPEYQETAPGGLKHPLTWLVVIAATALCLLVMNWIWWLMLPVVLSFIFYYASLPFLRWSERRGLTHEGSLALYLCTVTLALLIAVPAIGMVTTSKLSRMRQTMPTYAERVQRYVDQGIDELSVLYVRLVGHTKQTSFEMATARSRKKMRIAADDLWQTFIGERLPAFGLYLASWIPSLLLVPYLAFFLLKDGHRLKKLIMRGVPNAFFERVLLLFDRVDDQIKRYFAGMIDMTLLDTLTLAPGLWLLGLPYGIFGPAEAVLLSLMAAILAWVPYVGAIFGGLLVMGACFILAPGNFVLLLWVFLLFVVVRILDEFIYTPMTIGKSMDVHPLLTVMIIFCGGMIAGIPGLLLAMPVLGIFMALGEVVGRAITDDRLRARHQHTLKLRWQRASKDLG
jgi:predicted PurR-regulated permease PerM